MLSYLFITAALALAIGLPFEFQRLPGETLAVHLVLCLLSTVTLWVIPATFVALLLQGVWWLALQGRAL
ncbi:hypothetical protein P3T65_26960 [Pseudomonas nitroreducens]|uniref:hypothetical protein n=1 Tax=Pseudomonas nitroreducens TaxID=46680 RepID=UPI0023F8F632|nr:hypothetical protein [Pseudomonas nitroreducens]WEW97824.1 hypothetical protein P3T65_26960 [Pseudomonas nitroreducens]